MAVRRRMLLSLLLMVRVVPARFGDDFTTGQNCTPPGAEIVEVRGCQMKDKEVKCDPFPDSEAPSPGVAYLRLDIMGHNFGNATTSVYCASLETFGRGEEISCKERLHFQNFTVGWAAFSSTLTGSSCSDKYCSIKLHILEEVAALKPFRFSSSTNDFWDFSSPAFSVERGSLRSVTFNFGYLEKTHCEVSLVNIYNLGNTSIEEFQLHRNYNNSTDLKLGPMPKMRVFALASCSIQKFPEDAHLQMPALDILQLGNNPLLSVPAAVASMQQLRVLDLTGTRLGRLAGQLPSLPNLRELLLRNSGICCLQEEEASAFHGVPDLEALDISQNALTAVGKALRHLSHLEILDASDNLLTDFPELQLPNGALVSFVGNRLKSLPDCTRLGGSDIELELNDNLISAWDDSPDMLRCVKSLTLSNNTISVLTERMLRSLDRVKQVSLTRNPLDCTGCPFVRLQQWLLKTSVRVWGGDEEGAATTLRCVTPTALVGMSVGAAPSYPAACEAPAGPLALALSLTLGLAGAAALVFAATACYRYRFEIAYSAHLLRLRTVARRSRQKDASSGDDQFLFDAFILYSCSDRPWVVGTLVPLLESGPQRYHVCLHERDFQVGTVIVQNISLSMDRSKHTIIALSKDFLKSKWCLWEMDLANHRTLDPSQRDFIILLELEPLDRSSLPRHLRFLMDTRTYLEWHETGDPDHQEQALRKLKRALGPSFFSNSTVTQC